MQQALSLFREPAADPIAHLRDYQVRTVREAEACLAHADSCLIVLATGCGKTETAIAIGQRHLMTGRQVLVLAHRRGLVHQFASRIRRQTGDSVQVEMGELRSSDAKWIVASKDSLHASRLRDADHIDPTLIICDEAHHSPSASFRRTIDHFKGAKVVGLTATPDRSDEIAMSSVFEEVCTPYEIDDAIKDGWLVPINLFRATVESLDFSHVKTTAGDLNQKELDALMKVEAIAHKTVQVALEHGKDRKRGLLFTTSIENAQLIAEVFNHYEPGSAVSIDSKQDESANDQAVARHKSGEVKWLVNVGMYTEGMDDPFIDCVVMARPTKSRSLYTQSIGRGTRALPGLLTNRMTLEERRRAIAGSGKPNVLVLDITGQAGRHSLVGPEDVLGGKLPEEVIERAKKQASGGDVQTILDLAQKDVEAERRRKIREAAKVHMRVGSRLIPIDPFAQLGIQDDGKSFGDAKRFGFRKPTEKMVATLQKAGIEPSPNLSFREASRLIDELKQRWSTNKCTIKQMATMEKAGIRDCKQWSFDKARRVIDEIAQNRWWNGAPMAWVKRQEATAGDEE